MYMNILLLSNVYNISNVYYIHIAALEDDTLHALLAQYDRHL